MLLTVYFKSIEGFFFISGGTEFQILTPWNLIFLSNVSVLYLSRYKLYSDDDKRVDRLSTDTTQVKKRRSWGESFYACTCT